jgi:hypothetical protein
MDLSKPDDYAYLAETLQARKADTVVMYVATAPTLFTTVCEQIAAVGLNTPHTRVVLEKPLGHDLASNRAINSTVCRSSTSARSFRIDHYLGKPGAEPVCAALWQCAVRALWRREHIANIQITIAEELGVEKRGAFYETTGALRDMVQNHALQLLCAIGMEPPINSHADAIRDEKLKVLRSLKPWTLRRWPGRDPRPVRAGNMAAAGAGPTAASRRDPRQQHRDLCRAAHRNLQLALGRRAVLHPHRQAAGRARRAHRGELPAHAPRHLQLAASAWPTAW